MEDAGPPTRLVIAHVKGLATALHAIRAGSKQACCVKIDSSGLELRWEDESKTLQSLVFLKPEMFGQFSVGSVARFSVQFSQLLDTLNVFSPIQSSTELCYPGPNGELSLESSDNSRGTTMVTYARIASIEMPDMRDLEDFWEEPHSHFLTQGAVMKEVIEDLEWPGGNVTLQMDRNPPRLLISASGTGRLEADMPVSELSGFHCEPPELCHSYRYKALRAAFCNLPNPKEAGAISTKVTVDRNGMLKVTHVISLAPPSSAHDARFGGGSQGGWGAETQRVFDLARSATVHFFILPLAE
ncbi:hypothetical protein FOA52_010026 [Chlamydomonas sp. UWO 241]|nr:hypothetical protein FOA52_010026 [Chlamydomonas sp. UWO 241]